MENTGAVVVMAAAFVCLLCGSRPDPAAAQAVGPRKIFSPAKPVALLRIRKLDGTHAEGTIVCVLHAWSFPYVGSNGEVGGGRFTCAGELRVSGAPGATIERATGTRTLYFQSVPQPISFDDPGSFSAGQRVATESLTMRLVFGAGLRKVTVQMTSHRVSAQPFQFNGRQIIPPANDDTSAETLEGSYSARLGGYLLKDGP